MTKLRTDKTTIKNDPFATVIPLSVEAEVEPPRVEPEIVQEPIREVAEKPKIANEDRQRRATSANSIRVAQTTRQKLTVHLESSLAERVKNAAYWNPKLTIAGIAEQGIRLAIEKHEREHGGKYPPREGELVGGRPIK